MKQVTFVWQGTAAFSLPVGEKRLIDTSSTEYWPIQHQDLLCSLLSPFLGPQASANALCERNNDLDFSSCFTKIFPAVKFSDLRTVALLSFELN